MFYLDKLISINFWKKLYSFFSRDDVTVLDLTSCRNFSRKMQSANLQPISSEETISI